MHNSSNGDVSGSGKSGWSDDCFRTILDSATDYAFVLLDRDSVVIGWSAGAERILGWSEQEMLGQSGTHFFTPEDRANGEAEAEINTALREGRAEDERWHIRKDGSRFWGSGVLARIDDPDSPGFVKIMRDLTERALAQEQDERLARLEREHLSMQLESAGAALHRSKEQLRALARGVLEAQEAERRRIARELHDDFAQQTALIQFSVRAAHDALPVEIAAKKQLAEIERHVESLALGIRRVSHQLHPAILDDLGIDIALATLCESMSKARSEPIEYTGAAVPPLAPEIGTAVYRIAQESLRNAAKHAPDSAVRVSLYYDGEKLCLRVEDSGPGFNLEQYERGSALGIISMQERALALNGTLIIETKPGDGTTVTLNLPLPESQALCG
jgi:PAS domain S-box-containing protein